MDIDYITHTYDSKEDFEKSFSGHDKEMTDAGEEYYYSGEPEPMNARHVKSFIKIMNDPSATQDD